MNTYRIIVLNGGTKYSYRRVVPRAGVIHDLKWWKMAQRLSEGLKEALRTTFDKVDTRSAGWLDINGVREVLQLIGQNPTKGEMKSFFSNGTRRIDRDSIADFIEGNVPLKSKATINEEIAEAFAKFNSEETDLISQAEFRVILTTVGYEPLTDQQADIVISSLNKNRNDRLNVSDLSTLLSD